MNKVTEAKEGEVTLAYRNKDGKLNPVMLTKEQHEILNALVGTPAFGPIHVVKELTVDCKINPS